MIHKNPSARRLTERQYAKQRRPLGFDSKITSPHIKKSVPRSTYSELGSWYNKKRPTSVPPESLKRRSEYLGALEANEKEAAWQQEQGRGQDRPPSRAPSAQDIRRAAKNVANKIKEIGETMSNPAADDAGAGGNGHGHG